MNLLKNYEPSELKNNNSSSYFLIKNALDANEYSEILHNYPDQETCKKHYIARTGELKGDPNRYDIFSEDILDGSFSPALKNFIKRHTHKDFIHQLIDIFKLNPKLKNLPVKTGEFANAKSSNAIISSANPGVNFPRAEKPRGIHLDLQSSAVVGLFYLRREDDESSGGDLDFFSYKDDETRKKYHAIGRNNFNKHFKGKSSHEDLIKINTIKYEANTCVFFKNNMDAIHAVTDRKNAKVQRNLVNIYFTFSSQENL
jgi:hypothetical protein